MRWLVLALVVAVVGAVVAGVLLREREVPGAPVAVDGPTVWQLIETDPRNDAESALQAFGHVFGAIPGVRPPAGRPEPADLRLSGTGPLRWVLAHWDRITPEQRAAVLAATVPPDDPPRLRQHGPKGAVVRLIEARTAQLSQDLGTRLGKTIPAPRVHVTNHQRENVRAWTFVLGAGGKITDAVREKGTLGSGPAQTCDLYIPRSTWKHVSTAVPADVAQTIAHELTHCYQGFLHPTVEDYRNAPRWLIEGAADFTGSVVAQAPPPPARWPTYLTTEAPLFTRKYTSMGWWFHLDHIGRAVWPALAKIWSGAMGDQDAYIAAGGDLDDVYDTWASGFLRHPGFGDPWEVHGIGVGADLPPRKTLSATSPVDAPAFDVRVAQVDTGPDSGDRIVRISASQPTRFHDNASFEDIHITEGDYCVGESCVCPKDTERAGQKFRRVTAPLWLAVPGGETGAQAVTDTVPLLEYCKKKRPDRKKPTPAPATPAGYHPHGAATNPNGPDATAPTEPVRPAAGSTGDPHLLSFDGHAFDFQAAGEFTLALSDGLEVQTRQEPVRLPNGTENTTVTVNTAVAASIAGDRVAVYATDKGIDLRVDGKPTEIAERTLPQGGTIAPRDGGVVLRWPDGSAVWVLTAAPGSLNVLVGPAETRRGAMSGLLGEFGGTALTLVDRSGKRHTAPSGKVLYDVVGESWRVGRTSLFDYEPGESTATFTRRDVPTAPTELTAEQRKAGEAACAAVTDPAKRANCVFDVGISGDTAFAAGYRRLETPLVGGDLEVGDEVGPERLEIGQRKTFTVTDPTAKELYFAAGRPCSGALFWRVTGPDGAETSLVGVCNDIGRWTSAKPGAWRVEVSVNPAENTGGEFGFRVLAAPASTEESVALPVTVAPTDLRGPGAQTRYRFQGAANQTVTLTAGVPCDSANRLEWGLENPDGYRITLRTPTCRDLGTHRLDVAGAWAIVIYNPTADDTAARFGFTAK